MADDVRHILALSQINGLGPVGIRNLVGRLTAEGVFGSSDEELGRCGLSATTIGALRDGEKRAYAFADREIDKAEKEGARLYAFTDQDFPRRMASETSAPLVLYYRGSTSLDTAKTLAVVGTRRPTDDGRNICDKIVGELCRLHPDLLIISGLAYGIDIVAHRSALAAGRNTVAVMATGLDTIYPSQHRETAKRIEGQGAIVTEFAYGTPPEAYNFVSRNRIIAMLSDAVLVVESGLKGGSLITAKDAQEMSRRLFSVPGFPGRQMSMGCNALIKSGQASMVECADDIDKAMGWSHLAMRRQPKQDKAPTLFPEPQDEKQKAIVAALQVEDCLNASQICERVGIPPAQVNATLLQMEFAGIVRSLPGNEYKLMI